MSLFPEKDDSILTAYLKGAFVGLIVTDVVLVANVIWNYLST